MISTVDNSVLDGSLGRTFKCIIEKQFQSTRDGDRFWYQNDNQFTSSQLDELENFSLAKLVCLTTGIDEIQPELLKPQSLSGNGRVSCDSIGTFEVGTWKEDASCEVPDFANVTWKIARENSNKIIFGCRNHGQTLSGSSSATCNDGILVISKNPSCEA